MASKNILETKNKGKAETTQAGSELSDPTKNAESLKSSLRTKDHKKAEKKSKGKKLEDKLDKFQKEMERSNKGKTIGKSKSTALILAILLGFWAWLYTYKKDDWKFWSGSILSFLLILFTLLIHPPIYINKVTISLMLILFLASLGLHAWPIIDYALKPKKWFEKYNKKK